MSRGTSVVVGGGISGMLAALLLARQGARVLLVEREPELGGLLRCFEYPEAGRFDYGMHNMYDTGVPELDALLFGLLPREQWQLLEGPRRDLAGLYWHGRLQRNSLFMDLRDLDAATYERCAGSFLRNLNAPAGSVAGDAGELARQRFGPAIADSLVAPVLAKLFRREPQALDPMALALTSISRVVLFDQPPFADLMKSELLRERVGFPEQRQLPPAYSAGRKAYYPRDYGMCRVVAAFQRLLEQAGVRIRTGATVARISSEGGRVRSVEVRAAEGSETVAADGLYWSTGLPALALALGLPLAGLPFDPPPRTVVINMLLDGPLEVGDLFYFYCYDPAHHTFRVTNFPAYCDGAVRDGRHPICVEFLWHEPTLPPAEQLAALAEAELRAMGVVRADQRVLFARAEPLPAGFPMPSLKNTQGLARVRELVAGQGLANLTALGVLSEPGLFFQRDVLRRTWERLQPGAAHA